MQTCSMQCYKLRVESTVWRDWCQLQHFAQYHIRANHWTKSLWPLWRHRLRIRVHKFDVILFCTYSLQKCILFFRITYNQLQEDLNTFMLLSELSSLSETSIRTKETEDGGLTAGLRHSSQMEKVTLTWGPTSAYLISPAPSFNFLLSSSTRAATSSGRIRPSTTWLRWFWKSLSCCFNRLLSSCV